MDRVLVACINLEPCKWGAAGCRVAQSPVELGAAAIETALPPAMLFMTPN